MANLPYFKFIVADWLLGNIVHEPLENQGLFVNICAMYWKKRGDLTLTDIQARFKKPKALQSLNGRFFSASENGKIKIDFLDEQLVERSTISKTNSINGGKGGRPKVLKTQDEKPNANQTLTETKPKKSNKEEEKNKKKKRTDKKFTAPTLDEFKNYFLENGFDESVAVRAWTGYNVADWHDSQGNKVKNWKQKCQNVWFKDDNKTKPGKQTTGTVKILQPQEDFRGK
jgi:hypothetical protein